MRQYAGIDEKYCTADFAKIYLQSIPYDGTSTWGKGADKGFDAFLNAAENMELYDIETDSEVYLHGVHILPSVTEDASPEAMFEAVYKSTKSLLKKDKFLTFFGGEHSVSIGVIKAFYEKFENLSVLHLDAHADLRASYLGSHYNHACALHDASKNTNLVQVGIRSMDACEKQYINYDQTYFAEDIYGDESWMQKAIDQLGENVYLTIDLDVFDGSIMPTTGTPEPGGMNWNTVIRFLRKAFEQKNIVGFDIVELAPIEGYKAPVFLTSKLYYKLLSYKFELKK
ncbi:MAG: agmatinase [Bacteroidales bacterium]|nr:agmatinase [Bacteroidales bacterium]